MNRTVFSFAALAALLAACAICVVPALAAKDTKTTVSAKYKEADADDPYGMTTFEGKVGPSKCAKGRSVSIKDVGKAKTNSKGKFEIALSGPADPGKYKVKVKAKGSCLAGKATVTVK